MSTNIESQYSYFDNVASQNNINIKMNSADYLAVDDPVNNLQSKLKDNIIIETSSDTIVPVTPYLNFLSAYTSAVNISSKDSVSHLIKLDRSWSESCSKLRNTTTAGTAVNSSRYKTEMCRPFEENGYCKYGNKCQFAHGKHELQNLSRHPKYKTDLCRTFHTTGLCPYGPRCHFVHIEEEQRVKALEKHPGVIQPPSRSNSFTSLSSYGSSLDSYYSSSLIVSPTTMTQAYGLDNGFSSTTSFADNHQSITSKNTRSNTIWSSSAFELMTPLNVQTQINAKNEEAIQHYPEIIQPLSRPNFTRIWCSLSSSTDSLSSSLTASPTTLSPAYGSDDIFFSTNINNLSPTDQQSFSSDSARSSPIICSSEVERMTKFNTQTKINTVNDVFSLQQQFTGMNINPESIHDNLNLQNVFDDDFLAQIFRESQSFNDVVPSMSPVDSLSEISVGSY